MVSAILAALALSQTPVCAAVPDAYRLWADPVTRFVFVGEIHGTTEAPAAFAELVCEASEDRPVVVALEMPASMQPDLEAWMASDGGPDAQATLLAHRYWDPAFADGRSSRAKRDMLSRLHALKAAGRDLTVRAFVPTERRPDGFDQSYYEIDMARMLVDAAASRPEALVLALGGRLHNRKTMSERHGFLFAAGHLKPSVIRSVGVAPQGGEVWACFGDTRADCGLAASEAAMAPDRRGVILEPDDARGWDGVLALGPTTGSPPARAG